MIDGLIIDSFAGGGGASTGIEMALDAAFEQGLLAERRYVDYAINHDHEAIAMHSQNHPNTVHLPCSIWSVDWEHLVNKRAVALMWFSPDCKHFSKAKGGKPVKKNIRDLAWVVVKAARQVRPAVIMLENVEEFQTWGPLMFKRMGDGATVGDANLFQPGKGAAAIPDDVVRDPETGEPVLVPDPARKGQTFREWTAALRRLGYHMEWRELRACDYGAPTIRKRFFMVARRDGRKIVWPKPTHGDPKSEAVKNGDLKPWRTAAEIIDWSISCPSIFLTKEEGRAIGVKRPLESATMDRIAKGVDRYVVKANKPFIVNLTHQGGDRNEAVDAPMNTVTGAHRGEKAVVVPSIVGVGSRAAQSPPRGGDMPFGTVTTSKGGMHGIVATTMVPEGEGAQRDDTAIAPGLVQTGYGERQGQQPRALDVEKPLGTVVAGGVKHAAVAPVLVRTAHGERDKKGKKRGRGEHDVEAPLPTVLASPEFGVVGASIIRTDQTSAVRAGVCNPEDPLRTVTTAASHAVVTPHLMTMRNAQKPHSSPAEPTHTITAGGAHLNVVAPHLTKFRANSVGSGAEEPVPTVTANSYIKRPGGAPPIGVVSAFLAQHNVDGHTGEGNPGRAAEVPVSTITTSGSHQNLVTGHMVDMHGSDMRMAGLDDPLRTLTAQGYHAAQVAAFLTKYYGTDQDPKLGSPLHTATTKDRFGLVTVMIEGEPWIIADIGMRMLTPRELFRAQGFPDSYIIDFEFEVTEVRRDGRSVLVVKRLTKTAQIRMCGNSVCPPMAEALVRTNLVEDAGLFVRPANDPERLGGLFADVPLWPEERAA